MLMQYAVCTVQNLNSFTVQAIGDMASSERGRQVTTVQNSGHIQLSSEQSRIIILLVPTVHSSYEAACDNIQLRTEQNYISIQWVPTVNSTYEAAGEFIQFSSKKYYVSIQSVLTVHSSYEAEGDHM